MAHSVTPPPMQAADEVPEQHRSGVQQTKAAVIADEGLVRQPFWLAEQHPEQPVTIHRSPATATEDAIAAWLHWPVITASKATDPPRSIHPRDSTYPPESVMPPASRQTPASRRPADSLPPPASLPPPVLQSPPASIAPSAFVQAPISMGPPASLYPPASIQNHAPLGGVVICPPLGFEYVHSHRSLRRLADELARSGLACLRIDYHGTGNSPGDAFAPDRVNCWVNNIVTAANMLSERLDDLPIALVGLRMGALLAALACRQLQVQQLVLWAPVASGKRYIREQRAASLLSPSKPDDSGWLEAGGFVFSPTTIRELSELELNLDTSYFDGEALLVERDDLPLSRQLVARFEQADIAVTRLRPPGYADMMADPHFARIPSRAIDDIVQWLSEGTPQSLPGPAQRPSQIPSTKAGQAPLDGAAAQRSCELQFAGKRLREELCCFGPPTLFGVLSEPIHGADPARPTLVLSNGGAVHTVGPNRVYVELARALGAAGYRVFRFDLRNLGDSLVGSPADDNHPYPPTALVDVRAALRWLKQRRGSEQFVLSGLCSGAYTAFHAGLATDIADVVGVLPINPLTFYWTPGMPLDVRPHVKIARESHRYSQAARDPARWLKLLRGEADVRYIVRFIQNWSGERLAKVLAGTRRAMSVKDASPLPHDIKRLVARGHKLGFVLSEGDGGMELLMTDARRTVQTLRREGKLPLWTIKQADHTFSQRAWRQTLALTVLEALRQHFDAAESAE